jgi:valyl-tRNA synthetase
MLENNLKVLHPLCRFDRGNMANIGPRTKEEALIVSTWPEMKPFNANLISDFESTMEVISGIRTIRRQEYCF